MVFPRALVRGLEALVRDLLKGLKGLAKGLGWLQALTKAPREPW